jgi:hypothetical protein
MYRWVAKEIIPKKNPSLPSSKDLGFWYISDTLRKNLPDETECFADFWGMLDRKICSTSSGCFNVLYMMNMLYVDSWISSPFSSLYVDMTGEKTKPYFLSAPAKDMRCTTL